MKLQQKIMNELPHVEKIIKPYHYEEGYWQLTQKELTQFLAQRGIFIPEGTWVGTNQVNKDGTVTINIDGNFTVTSSQSK